MEPRSRSPAFVNHVSLQLCHCAWVPRVDFDTTDYWWDWVHVETSLRGQVNKGGMLGVYLPFQYTSFQACFCLICHARMHSIQTNMVCSVSQVQALGKCSWERCSSWCPCQHPENNCCNFPVKDPREKVRLASLPWHFAGSWAGTFPETWKCVVLCLFSVLSWSQGCTRGLVFSILVV